RQWKAMKETNILSKSKTIKASTLLIHCEDDGIVSIKESELLARKIPNNKFISIPKGGHTDPFTRFSYAEPAESKSADEAAIALFNFCLIYGPPAILHTDNGGEFIGAIFKEIMSLWPNIKMGLVEKGNDILQMKFGSWMEETSRGDWCYLDNSLNIANILINDNYDQEELSNTSASNTLASNTSVPNTSASDTSASNTSAILDTNNNNELNLEGSIISDDYYLENFESRHNLEGFIISDNYYLEDSTIPDNYYSKNLKTYKAQSKIIEVDNNLIESNNNIIDSRSSIVNSQKIIIISDSE
ncbi:22370_t:CDS:2, partial [Gigaspora rosea]